jgi:heme exporter protein A
MLHDALSARENLRFVGRLHGVPNLRARIDQVLRSLDLDERADEPLRQLSRGLAQRAAIARALLHDPDILLLDEPYTGLDRASGMALTEVLAGLRRRGRTLLLVTHDPERALAVAERLVILRQGRVVAERLTGGMSPREFDELLAGADAAPASVASP